MKVKIKRTHKDSKIPTYSRQGDAGMDLTAVSKEYIDSEHTKYGFGIAIQIPSGHVGLIFPRSSCYKQRQLMSNCVGVIDSNYIGEISAVFIGQSSHSYKVGERCAQLIVMPIPTVEFIEVDELEETNRGVNGYGSSGK